jgi:hypothetical protein
MPNKRLAQSKLVRMVLNKGEALARLDQIEPMIVSLTADGTGAKIPQTSHL